MWREYYRHAAHRRALFYTMIEYSGELHVSSKRFQDQLPNSPYFLPTTPRAPPFLTETVPFACAHRYSTLVFALLGYLLGLCCWSMSCCRRIATCFLTWRAGIVGSCWATVVRAVAGRYWLPVFKGPVGCLLLTLCFELGHALFFDVLLSEVVGTASGCQGHFIISCECWTKRKQFICLPTKREPHPSLKEMLAIEALLDAVTSRD